MLSSALCKQIRGLDEKEWIAHQGVPVEVQQEAEARAELALRERLRAEGVLTPAEAQGNGADGDDEFEPVTFNGQPLSEQIIAERRSALLHVSQSRDDLGAPEARL